MDYDHHVYFLLDDKKYSRNKILFENSKVLSCGAIVRSNVVAMIFLSGRAYPRLGARMTSRSRNTGLMHLCRKS